MVNLSLKVDNDKQKYIIAKLDPDNKILNYQIEMINNNLNKGLLYIEKRQFNSEVSFAYNVDNYVSLASHISNPNVTASEIASILKNIIWITKSIKEYLLFEDSLILDINCIFINQSTKNVDLIYVPTIINNVMSIEIRLKNIMQSITTMNNIVNSREKQGLVKTLLFIVNSNYYDLNFALKNLEDFENLSLKTKEPVIEEKEIVNNNIEVKNEDISRHKKKGIFSKIFKTGTGKLEYEQKQNTEEFRKSLNLKGKEISSYEDNKNQSSSYLLFNKNGTFEKITITGSEFTIGRLEGKVQCFINNSAVSKNHATIKTVDNNKYIFDYGSSNGTFLNGERLKTNKSYLLKNNDEILFAKIKAIYKE